MTETYHEYGIFGVNPNGATEQRLICPQCLQRKSEAVKTKDLAVNIEKRTWQCFSTNCGWTGFLKSKVERPVYKVIKLNSKPLNSFEFFEKRGISKETIIQARITRDKKFMITAGKEVPVICFNYYIGDDLINIKYRDMEKNFMQEKDATKIFYGLNDIEETNECIITEGEIDKLSFNEVGLTWSVSVPDGAINPNVQNIVSKLSYIDNCAEYFKEKTKIYLATDNDAPGKRLMQELARRFGRDKCYIIKFPNGCKDANEVLMKFGKNELIKCYETAESYPIEGVHYANEFKENVQDLYENGYPGGAKTGWEKLDERIKFFDSFFMVITGIPSHGKTAWLDNLMVRLALKNNWKFGIFSPEYGKQEIHIQVLTEILIGKSMLPNYSGQMSQQELLDALKFIHEHFYFVLPPNEDYKLSNVLESARYLVLKHGIKSLIIDPWNTIEHDFGKASETEYTKKVLNQLLFFERNNGLLLGLVAHPRKMQKIGKLYEVATLYDINGSANFYNKAEIGISIYRKFSDDCESTIHTAAYIQKVKHKFIGRTGMIKFDFDVKSQRFYEQESLRDDGNWLDKESEIFKHFQDIEDNEPPF